eukprot:5820477-Prymnesium_polylepis.1
MLPERSTMARVGVDSRSRAMASVPIGPMRLHEMFNDVSWVVLVWSRLHIASMPVSPKRFRDKSIERASGFKPRRIPIKVADASLNSPLDSPMP